MRSLVATIVAAFVLFAHPIWHLIRPSPTDSFRPQLTPHEFTEVFDLISTLSSQMDKYNVTFILSYGSLIGAFRHHGLIPWDDDVDLIVPEEDREKLIEAMENLPDHVLLQETYSVVKMPWWKVFKRNSSINFKLHEFSWPYVDIFLFNDKDGLIKMPEGGDWASGTLYPLIPRPFVKMNSELGVEKFIWIQTPCEFPLSERILYECVSSAFSHKNELPIPIWNQKVLPCEDLLDSTPVVFRWTNGSRIYEQLRIKNKALYTYSRDLVTCSSKPSKLTTREVNASLVWRELHPIRNFD